MTTIDLFEGSPNTPSGSKSQDLNLGKLWLCRTLARLELDEFDNAYALGSWYGSIAQYMLARDIRCNQAILVDIDPKNTEYVNANAVSNHVKAITQDCNNTVFEGDNILVINTSTNDMKNTGWYDNIPSGSIVALQGRDQQPKNKDNLCQTIEAFDSAYTMTETYCLAEIPLTCVEGVNYNRFMKIGLK